MKSNEPLIVNEAIDTYVKATEKSVTELCDDFSSLRDSIHNDEQELQDLEARMARLMGKRGVAPISNVQMAKKPQRQPAESKTTETPKGAILDLDLVVACITGGIAVLVDFLVVKIPKTSKIYRDGQPILQEGSPMTSVLRKIGFTSNGKTSKWVSCLEGYFHVNFDTSIIKGEKGFTPRSHRLYSVAHDPSPSGFLFALADAIRGTTTYISKDGLIKFVSTHEISVWKILATPIIWIGHILSDIFTRAGVPIPGSCLLRTLQFGSFGEKGRTIGQVVEYMYIEGYDLRHLATMSVENAVIELIIRLYNILTKPRIAKFARPQALIEADEELQDRRLQGMRLEAYAIAACGNIAKLAVYQWNPNALNLTVWAECLRTAIKEFSRRKGTTQMALDAIEMRQSLEETFAMIEEKLSTI